MSYENLSRLPDPTTSPEGPGFVSQQLTDNNPGMMHNLNHGGSIAVKFSGSYWTINIAYPQLTIAEGNTLIPFLYSLQGGFTNFYVQLATHANPVTGAWVANGIQAADVSKGTNTNEVDITNWSLRGVGNELSPGDFIKFTESNKIYLITGTAGNADNITLTLNTDVIGSLATSGIEPNDIKFRVRLKGKTPAMVLTADGLYESIAISMRENIL